jgi:RNA polymerase sigma-70 factor, ECF subfamily
VVGKFVDAWERADVDAVVGLLAEDVLVAMPPVPTWFRGRADVAIFLARGPLRTTSRLLVTQANGQPAFGHYKWEEAQQAFVAKDLIILRLAGPQIADITAFRSPGLLPGFGLPERI